MPPTHKKEVLMGYNASGEFTLKFKALADKEKAEFIEKAGKDGYTGETFREIVEDILHEAYCFTFSKWTLGQAGKTSLMSGYRENTTYREDDFNTDFLSLHSKTDTQIRHNGCFGTTAFLVCNCNNLRHLHLPSFPFFPEPFALQASRTSRIFSFICCGVYSLGKY